MTHNLKTYPTPEALAERSRLLARHAELVQIIRRARASRTPYEEASIEMAQGNLKLKALEQQYDFKSYDKSQRGPLMAAIKHLASDDTE